MEEEKRIKDLMQTKSLTQQNYMRERHFLLTKIRSYYNALIFFADNHKLPEFQSARISLACLFALPLAIHITFMVYRPISFIKNISVFSAMLGCGAALNGCLSNGLAELASQNTIQGQRVTLY